MTSAPDLSGRRHHIVTLAAWGVLFLAPMLVYALPLWQQALSDTPTAYLIWVPVITAIWGCMVMSTGSAYPDDGELDGLLGVALLGMSGLALAIGPFKWPYVFLAKDAGVLLWPLWGLGLSWLVFGVGSTRRLAAPLAFLFLAWPPLLTAVSAIAQGTLVQLSVSVLAAGAGAVAWIHQGLPSGTFLIRSAAQWVPVYVSEACSGADGLLGAAVLLPVMLMELRGTMLRRLTFVAAALALAVVLNLVRLGSIVAALHFTGAGFALAILHPALGFILFGLLGLVLLWMGRLLRLGGGFSAIRFDTLPGGLWRIMLGGLFAAGLFVSLIPALSPPLGSASRPLAVASASPSSLLPSLPGYAASRVTYFNDASVLGPDSFSVARTYLARSGGIVLAEVWSTPDPWALESFNFTDCLLYHGSTIVASQPFQVASGALATIFDVTLPPQQVGGRRTSYVDAEWDGAIRLPDGAVRYVRFSLAALAGAVPPARSLPGVFETPGGLESVAVAPPFGLWPTSMKPAEVSLESFASTFTDSLHSASAFVPAPTQRASGRGERGGLS